MMRSFVRIGALAGSIVAVASVVTASVPDSAGLIHGCINNATRVVRIIDPAMSGNLGRCITQSGPLRERNAGVVEPDRPGGTGRRRRTGGSGRSAGPPVLPVSLARREHPARSVPPDHRARPARREHRASRGHKAEGPPGIPGEQGPAGPAGVAGLSDLDGVACDAPGGELGITSVAVAADGAVSLRCLAVAPRTLTVAVVSSVGGVVTSAPEGISCPPTCEADFATGTSVVLTAGPGSVFTERTWSGACTGTAATCAVTMDVDRAVTVTYRRFVPLQVQATNDQDPFGNGDGVVEVVIGNTTHTCRVGDGSTRTCTLPSTPAGTNIPVRAVGGGGDGAQISGPCSDSGGSVAVCSFVVPDVATIVTIQVDFD